MSPGRKRAHYRTKLEIRKANEEKREPTYRIVNVPEKMRPTEGSLTELGENTSGSIKDNYSGENYYSGR